MSLTYTMISFVFCINIDAECMYVGPMFDCHDNVRVLAAIVIQ